MPPALAVPEVAVDAELMARYEKELMAAQARGLPILDDDEF